MGGCTNSGVLFAAICAMQVAAVRFCAAGELGANKFDLMLQYTEAIGSPSNVELGYLQIRRAMARKAIADAAAADVPFLRVAVAGYLPVAFDDKRNDLALWQSDAPAFWARMDEMFDDLDRANIKLVPSFVWNPTQFPALANESLDKFLTDDKSRSRQIFSNFLKDFIARYKNRNTILFYELTNELNLHADLDLQKRNCRQNTSCVWGNFSTAQLTEFARQTVAEVKSLDPSRLVTSGYSLPRPAAFHLMQRPEFASGGGDWTADSPEEFGDYLRIVNTPFDISSVHIYPGKENVRFGRKPGEEYRMLEDAAAEAKASGKKLFVGEFGDSALTPFMTNLLKEIADNRADYAAIWSWEFYQNSTHETRTTEADRYSVEPAYSSDLVSVLRDTEMTLSSDRGSTAPAVTPIVVLTWPLPCALINQPIDLYAIASNGIKPVDQVRFFVDGKPVGTATRPPYEVHFDPASMEGHIIDIEARAVIDSKESVAFKSALRLNNAPMSACTAPDN